jgi:hypothetical protein
MKAAWANPASALGTPAWRNNMSKKMSKIQTAKWKLLIDAQNKAHIEKFAVPAYIAELVQLHKKDPSAGHVYTAAKLSAMMKATQGDEPASELPDLVRMYDEQDSAPLPSPPHSLEEPLCAPSKPRSAKKPASPSGFVTWMLSFLVCLLTPFGKVPAKQLAWQLYLTDVPDELPVPAGEE